jgi:hypothetical protein
MVRYARFYTCQTSTAYSPLARCFYEYTMTGKRFNNTFFCSYRYNLTCGGELNLESLFGAIFRQRYRRIRKSFEMNSVR